MLDCRKHKLALPDHELGQKMAVSDCRKNKMAVLNKNKKMRLVDNRKKVFFFCSLFFFPIFLFSFSFFLRERRKKRVEEKEEGFPPVSLCKK